MEPDTRAFIDPSAITYNLNLVRQTAPGCKVMAVVKANAYGFGLENVVPALRSADGFAVATVREAIRLYELQVPQPIFVLHGAHDTAELKLAIEKNFVLIVHQQEQISMLESYYSSMSGAAPLSIWLKVNSGMNRLGVVPTEVTAMWLRLKSIPQVSTMGLLTHLACSDESGNSLNHQQLSTFEQVSASLQLDSSNLSIANSGGVLNLPASRKGWVRPGIMLYGGGKDMAMDNRVRTVMTLRSRIIALRSIHQGDFVGYGASFVADRSLTLAVVAAGYGDGYPRHVMPNQEVCINGVRCPLVGRISMDMITVDVSRLEKVKNVKVGDEVELWGDQISVDTIAQGSGTISYELFCQLTPRVERVVLSEEQ